MDAGFALPAAALALSGDDVENMKRLFSKRRCVADPVDGRCSLPRRAVLGLARFRAAARRPVREGKGVSQHRMRHFIEEQPKTPRCAQTVKEPKALLVTLPCWRYWMKASCCTSAVG